MWFFDAWLSVTGDDIEVALQGKAALTEVVLSYFEDPNLATGSHRDWSLNDDYVAVTETAHWTTKSGAKKSQSALTIYELEGNLIWRVYCYTAVR